MSIVVEHGKRRREILEKALDIFIEEGFQYATFQKIAVRCGITRTTLYTYFKNKRDIFNYCIKQLLGGMEREIQRIRRSGELKSAEKLRGILTGIIDSLRKNRRILAVALDYLLYLSKNDQDPRARLRRRTIRLRHFLASTVIEGIRSGEFAPVNVRDADELLYGILESAAFRLAVLGQADAEELKRAASLAVRGLEAGRVDSGWWGVGIIPSPDPLPGGGRN